MRSHTMHQYFHILYPEDRWVLDDTLETWYWEALAADEVEPGQRTPAEMAEALADQGFITLGAEPPRWRE